MSNHEIYRKIKKEKQRKAKHSFERKPPPKGGWEKARTKFSKGDDSVKVIQDQCVCSHSKYHHDCDNTGTVTIWNKCMYKEICGCDHYQEIMDDKPNTKEQQEFLDNNEIESIPF